MKGKADDHRKRLKKRKGSQEKTKRKAKCD